MVHVGPNRCTEILTMCLYNLQNIWSPNRWWNIDFPMYLLNMGKIWALILPVGVPIPPKCLKCSYVCQTPPKKLVHGALKDAKNWLPNVLAQLTKIWPLMLCLWVCKHLPSQSENVPMCLRNLQKNLVHEALIDAEILTSPLPYVFAQLDPVIRYQCFTCGCANTFQVVWKYSNVSQNSLKKFGAWGPNRCWDIDFSPMYLLNLTKIWALMFWL